MTEPIDDPIPEGDDDLVATERVTDDAPEIEDHHDDEDVVDDEDLGEEDQG